MATEVPDRMVRVLSPRRMLVLILAGIGLSGGGLWIWQRGEEGRLGTRADRALRAGRWADVATAVDSFLTRHPASASLHMLRAQAVLGQHRWEAALDDLRC